MVLATTTTTTTTTAAAADDDDDEVLEKEGGLKRYRKRTKLYRQNRTFQNNKRKFYQQVGGEWVKTYQQPNAKEAKRFWSKIWE